MVVEERGYQSRAGGQSSVATPLVDAGGGAAAAIGAGVARLGAAANTIALDAYRADRQRTRDSEAADASRRFAELRLALDDESRVQRSAATAGGAGHVEAMRKRLSQRRAGLLDGLTEDGVRNQLETQFTDYESRLLAQEGDWEEGQRVGKLVNDQGQVSQIGANRTRNNPQAYAEELKAGYDAIDALSAPPDLKIKLREQHEQTVTVAYGNAMLESNPAAFKGMLASGAFDAILPPEQIEAFNNGIDVELRRAQAAAEHKASMEAKVDADQIGVIKAELAGGVEVGADRIVPLIQRAEARGDMSTATALRVQLVQTQTKRETETWVPAQWDNAIVALEAKAKRSPQEDIQLAALRQGRAAAIETYEQRPGEWAARNGYAPPALNLADPKSVSDYSEWRRVVMAETRGRDPGFPPAMLSDWKDKAKGAAPQRLALLNEMQALPPELRRAAMIEVVPGDPTMQHLAMLRSRVSRQYAVDGAVARTANPRLVSNDQAQIAFDGHVGRALSGMPTVFAANVKAAATNIYAGLAAQHGISDFNRGLFDKAVDLAMEQRVATWRGQRVIVPVDMGVQGFEAKLSGWNAPVPAGASNGAPVDSKGNPIRIGFIKEKLIPRAAGGGRYMFVDGAGSPLMTREGAPWLVDVRQLPNVATAKASSDPSRPDYGAIDFSAGRAGKADADWAVAGQGGVGR